MVHDALLWRYLSFQRLVWLLDQSKLYHARLDQMEDRFEGSVTTPYANKRASGEIPGYMPFANKFEATNNRRRLLTNYVTCWHLSPRESAAMWKVYSSESVGVAVVSSAERMRDATDLRPYRSGLLGPIDYFDFESDDMTLPFGKAGRPGYSKRLYFEYEREVRGMITLDDYPEPPEKIFSEDHIVSLAEKLDTGIEVQVDLNVLISAIYVGPLASEGFLRDVRTVSEQHGLGHLIHRSTMQGEPVF